MHQANSVKLPSDAVKAILAFLTRVELNAFSLISRQFVRIIHSPPFTAKPVLLFDWADIRRAYCAGCNSRKCGHMKTKVDFSTSQYLDLPAITHLEVHLDYMMHQGWLRFKEFSISLPRDNEVAREWLESLLDYSHCLSGCKSLYLGHYDETLPPVIMELVEKLRPMTERVSVYRQYKGR